MDNTIDFDKFSTEDLLKALELYDELANLGLSFVNQSAVQSISEEIEKRKEKNEKENISRDDTD